MPRNKPFAHATAGQPIPYRQSRTGLTFREVYQMIYHRRCKRRRGVLGKCHEIKAAMYAAYLHESPAG